MLYAPSMSLLVSLFVAMVCPACGSSPAAAPAGSASADDDSSGSGASGSGTAKGTVHSQTLSPKSAASATYVNNGDYLLVVLSNQADYCAATTAGQTHADHRSLVAILFSVDADGSSSSQALGTGTYTLSSEAPTKPGLYANAVFNASDASCQTLLPQDAGSATAGTITLTAVDAAGLKGSYSLNFGQDTLSGSFNAPDCVALADQAANPRELTCEP